MTLSFKGSVFVRQQLQANKNKQQQVWFQLVLGVATGHQHDACGPAHLMYKRCAGSRNIFSDPHEFSLQ